MNFVKKLIVVSDWADDTLTCQEFKSALEGFLKDSQYPNVSFVASTPSTIHTAYLIGQIVQTEEVYGRPTETVIFQNTDPRLKSEKGADFLILRLFSGIFICGPNAGFDFSLIKNKIEVAYRYQGLNEGSQFRSRDIYSRISAHLMDEIEDELELEEVFEDVIPTLTGYYIGHIDNFGNIKTTITQEDFKGKYEFEDMVEISINKITKKAAYVSHLFGARPGELVIYPGSSGQKDNRYLEISVWRHFTESISNTGSAIFNNPCPGMKIEIK